MASFEFESEWVRNLDMKLCPVSGTFVARLFLKFCNLQKKSVLGKN